MSEKYWRKKALKLEEEKESDSQMSGCMALIFLVLVFIFSLWIVNIKN